MNVSDPVQWSGSITKTLICVDSVQNGEPSGFLYNPYMPNRTAFFGYFSFIRVMDGFFDRMQCPQAYQKYRVWKAGESGERRAKEEVTRFMAEETFRPGKEEKLRLPFRCNFGRTLHGREPSPGWKTKKFSNSAAYWKWLS